MRPFFHLILIDFSFYLSLRNFRHSPYMTSLFTLVFHVLLRFQGVHPWHKPLIIFYTPLVLHILRFDRITLCSIPAWIYIFSPLLSISKIIGSSVVDIIAAVLVCIARAVPRWRRYSTLYVNIRNEGTQNFPYVVIPCS